MSRRPVNPARRFAEGASTPFGGSLHHKSRSSSLLPIGLVVVGALLFIGYYYSGSGGGSNDAEVVSKKAYGDTMHKVLHVGPDSCSVVTALLKEEDTEAWGVEPYDIEEVDAPCKSLIRKGVVRVADIKFPLPYRPKSFNLVIASDALDYLSPKYLNKTLPELARVASDGLIIFAGYPGKQKAKAGEQSKFGRPAKLRSSSWWIRYFVQTGLEENESIIKKFEQAAEKKGFKPSCQIFHLSS
ncbi:hypothetical protein MKW92_018419 [Papaver armeniacum]|nr:hypothetical protein MKW92_018419 [Papaver armeniacum]